MGIYFSGTGNTKFCVETFVKELDPQAVVTPIEDKDVISLCMQHEVIVFGYPVQYSELPKIVRDFIMEHPQVWKDKKIFVIATMRLFSGDGAGVIARLLKTYQATILGGLHVRMPDSICDEKVLKVTTQKNKQIVKDAKDKIHQSAEAFVQGKPTQEGLSLQRRFAGLLGQRLYFGRITKKYSKRLKIDPQACVGCGTCMKVCPLHNMHMNNHKAVSQQHCTMCYRCVNLCPKQAITLLGRQVVVQGTIDKYL